MAITIHTITSYAVQLLTKKAGEGAQSYISLRLYDHDNNNRGIVLFSDYGSDEPPKPRRRREGRSSPSMLLRGPRHADISPLRPAATPHRR